MMLRAAPVALLLVASCAGQKPIETARQVLDRAAEAGAIADKQLAKKYGETAAEALRGSSSMGEYEARMRGLDMAVDAIVAAKDALLLAQSAVDVWEATGDSAPFVSVVGCLASSLTRLSAALKTIGINPPSQLGDALDAVAPWAAVACGKAA